MTLLSFIAILASILVGLGWFLSMGEFWQEPKTDTPRYKRIWWKILHWFDLAEMPVWRKFLLKLLFSVLVLSALGCGFVDTYYAMGPENQGFFGFVMSLFITVFTVAVLQLIYLWGMTDVKELIRRDFLGLELPSGFTIALNIFILLVWLAVFICGLVFLDVEHVFAFIGVSVAVACIINFILILVMLLIWGVLVKIIGLTLVYGIVSYIRWLRK